MQAEMHGIAMRTGKCTVTIMVRLHRALRK